MPWAQTLPTLEESEANIRKAVAEFMIRTDLRLLLFLRGTGTLVGSSGLHRLNWEVPCFEIGYWMRTPYCGRGLMTEAVRGITEFARDQLGRAPRGNPHGRRQYPQLANRRTGRFCLGGNAAPGPASA